MRARYVFTSVTAMQLWLVPTLPSSADSFDGSWNIALITQSGSCERSGQVTGQIVKGALVYSAGGVSVSGRVSSEGDLNGKATLGPYNLIGSGRLVSNSGTGTWQAMSSAGPCSGIWKAKRANEVLSRR